MATRDERQSKLGENRGHFGAATKSIPPSTGSSVPPEPVTFQLAPGDRVGNYVIREQIGEGQHTRWF